MKQELEEILAQIDYDSPLTVACAPCKWERSRPNVRWAFRSLARHAKSHHPNQHPTSARLNPPDE